MTSLTANIGADMKNKSYMVEKIIANTPLMIIKIFFIMRSDFYDTVRSVPWITKYLLLHTKTILQKQNEKARNEIINTTVFCNHIIA